MNNPRTDHDPASVEEPTTIDTPPTRRPTPIDRALLSVGDGIGNLILVRHGQQQWPDPTSSVSGDWVDPPLSEVGRAQAECVADHLADEPVVAVYSSHLKRAHDTGRAVAVRHGLEVEVMPTLEEIHIFRDLPQDRQAIETLGEKAMLGIGERFVQTQKWDSYPATESSHGFRRRISLAVESAVASHPGGTVVVACHGGVINAYLAEILGTTADMFYRPVHASVHRLRFGDGRRVVHVLNEHHYLAAAGLVTH